MPFSCFLASCALLLFVGISFYYVDGYPTTPINDNIQVCGRDLADFLSKICKLGYNSYDTNDQESLLPKDRARRKRSITRECCLQPCSRSTLNAYCSFDPSMEYKTDDNSAVSEDNSNIRKKNTDVTGNGANKHIISCQNSTNSKTNSVPVPHHSGSSVSNDKNNEISHEQSTNNKQLPSPCLNNKYERKNEIMNLFEISNGYNNSHNNATQKIFIINQNMADGNKDISWHLKTKSPYYDKQPMIVKIGNNAKYASQKR